MGIRGKGGKRGMEEIVGLISDFVLNDAHPRDDGSTSGDP